MKRLLVYYACLPIDLLVAWPMVLAVRALWGRDLRWERGVLKCEFEVDTWATTPGIWPKGFYVVNRREILKARKAGEYVPPIHIWGGTSVVHGQLFGPGEMSMEGTDLDDLDTTEVHEDHHTVQGEAAQVGSCLLSHGLWAASALVAMFLGVGAVPWLLGALVWLLGGVGAVMVGGWSVAWLNGDERGVYKGSAHEIGAYAVGAVFAAEVGKSSMVRRPQPPVMLS